MRALRTLMLLVVAVAAAMAFATTASAQTVELTNESTGAPCSAVSPVVLGGETVGATGGCAVTAHSEDTVELAAHVFGIELHVADCLNEFTARLNGSGGGYLLNQSLVDAPDDPGGCTREPCEHADGSKIAWPVQGFEASGQEFLEVQFCVATLDMTSETQCEFDVPFTTTGHSYEFSANDLNGHTGTPRCELTGHWLTEEGPDVVEIAHS